MLKKTLAVVGICVSLVLLVWPLMMVAGGALLDPMGALAALSMLAVFASIGVGCVLALLDRHRTTRVRLLAAGTVVGCLMAVYAFWRFATYEDSGGLDLGDVGWFMAAIAYSIGTVVGGLAWLSFRRGSGS